jgi:hypothetical protein
MKDNPEERIQYFSEWCSVTDLEYMAYEYFYNQKHEINIEFWHEKEKEIFFQILEQRAYKMDINFSKNEQFKKQLLKLNKKIIDAFTIAYDKAEKKLKENDSIDQFNKEPVIEICLSPCFYKPLKPNGKTTKGIYDILNKFLLDNFWSQNISVKDGSKSYFRYDELVNEENFYRIKNPEFFNDVYNDKNVFCRALYSLRCRNKMLSWYDILNINKIKIKMNINVTYQSWVENIGKGIFWDDGIQSLSENEAENIRQEYMSRVSKDMSGLPVELLLDENKAWEKIGPYKRIKFQGTTKGKINWKNMYSMSIEESPQVLVKDAKISLTDDESQQVKDFVSKNKNSLLQISEQKLYLQDFLRKIENKGE